jgi:hypothetical protein
LRVYQFHHFGVFTPQEANTMIRYRSGAVKLRAAAAYRFELASKLLYALRCPGPRDLERCRYVVLVSGCVPAKPVDPRPTSP